MQDLFFEAHSVQLQIIPSSLSSFECLGTICFKVFEYKRVRATQKELHSI